MSCSPREEIPSNSGLSLEPPSNVVESFVLLLPGEKREKTHKQLTLFLGNPGVGKSTLLNAILKKPVFESGPCVGGGLTQVVKTVQNEEDGVYYVDSPGLQDVKNGVKAAKEIEEALKQDGEYRLVFVLTLEEGRLRPDDISSVSTIVEAIQVGQAVPYSIIINKVDKNSCETLKSDPSRLFAQLNFGQIYTSRVLVHPRDEKLTTQKNVIALIDSTLSTFVQSSPSVYISPAQVKPVKLISHSDKIEVINKKTEDLLSEKQMLTEKLKELETQQVEPEHQKKRTKIKNVMEKVRP